MMEQEAIQNMLLIRDHDAPPAIEVAACIHFLATTPVVTEKGEVKAKWEVVRIVGDKPLATTWAGFCEDHLGISPSKASSYKRIWETFAVGLGYGMGDLAEVNISALRSVLGAMAKLPGDEQRELFDRLRAAAKVDRSVGEGFVYLLSSELGYKIGRTVDLGSRLRDLTRQFNMRIVVVCSEWFNDCAKAEKALHACFVTKRISGEWFDLTEEDVEYIWGYMRKRLYCY